MLSIQRLVRRHAPALQRGHHALVRRRTARRDDRNAHDLAIRRIRILRRLLHLLPAFNTALFLSANSDDVRGAIAAGYPAGLVLPSKISDEDDDIELRVAFDFDGVLADDESETIFKANGLGEFHAHETLHVARPHQPGPLAGMFQKLAVMQKMEQAAQDADPAYRKIVRIAIITARSAPSHKTVNSLELLDVSYSFPPVDGNAPFRLGPVRVS